MGDATSNSPLEDSADHTSTDKPVSQSLADKYGTIRCLDLFSEYRRCISASHQFHQVYIHGKYYGCKMEKERLKNCFRWRTSSNMKARDDLYESFEEEQRNMHTANPPWETRDTPPEKWKN